jgi:hypothetical protein
MKCRHQRAKVEIYPPFSRPFPLTLQRKILRPSQLFSDLWSTLVIWPARKAITASRKSIGKLDFAKEALKFLPSWKSHIDFRSS